MDILIVEDEQTLGRAVQRGLNDAGHNCQWAKDGKRGLEEALTQKYDAVVLDLMLPELTGNEIVKQLRSAGVRTPVMILTAKGSVEDRVEGLRDGADDYLVKPFAMAELLARLDAICRRAHIRPSTEMTVGPLHLDLTNRRVLREGKEISLTPTEFTLLEYLMRYAGQVVTRKMLCEQLWEADWEGVTNVVEVHINRLRGKVDRGFAESLIQTVRDEVMSSERVKPIAISLRLRVAAWIAGAVVLTSAILLAVIREGVRQALLHELDASLQADASEILLERDQHLSEPALIKELLVSQAKAHREARWYAQLLAADGREVFATQTTPDRPLVPKTSGSGKPETIDGYRVVERRSSDGQAIVRAGMSLSAIDSDMDRIDRLVGGTALGMFLAAPLTGFLLATITLRPITEMRQRTALLRPQQLGARLPLTGTGDELDHLATVINHLLGRIAQYVGEHRGIMADAAHQLRTPLAAIRSSVEVILATDENSPDNRELLAKVIEQIESLETLVNQLLLLAETEVENLRLDTEHVPLHEIVRRALEMFDAVAESLGVTLEIGAVNHAEIQGNRHYLRQVVNNLIDNALKFTAIQPDGPRRISIDLTRHDHQGIVQLRIADSGIGIKPEHLTHIFDRFYRIDTPRRSEGGIGGNGLGLSIVKSVIDSHGGEIDVESTEGVGTTFIIKLPLARADALAAK